jgi:hypothetical protein
MRALVALAAALAVVAGTAEAARAPTAPARRCGTYAKDAIVAGRHRCLSEGASCRARLNRTYHRYGYTCSRGFLAIWWAGLRKPLHVPTLAPGAACPQTLASGTLRERGVDVRGAAPAYGPGPAYPALGISEGDTGATVVVLDNWGADSKGGAGWSGTKVLWTTPRYSGAVLVRGRQLDGPNPLGFDEGPQWTRTVLPELRLVGPEYGLHPAATYARAPGCYAYQVDGLRFSYRIILDVSIARAPAQARAQQAARRLAEALGGGN